MKRTFFTVVLAALVLGQAHGAERLAHGGAESFWAEFEGRVAIDGGNAVVRVVPDTGLPLVLDNAAADEWRGREGRRIELEGRIHGDAAEARMEVWEFSLENDSRRPDRHALESEGRVVAGPGAPVLRTRLGDVPLVGAFAGSPAGARVEVKGSLAARGGALALHVVEMELEDE